MLPVLFSQFGITIYTFGIFAFLAFFWFLYFFWRNIRITIHRESDLFDIVLVASICALIVGRIIYVLFNLAFFLPKGIIAMFAVHLYPGIHGLTGLIGGLIALLVLARIKKLPALEVAALAAPGLMVAFAILSIGQLFVGGEVGAMTAFPLRVKYVLYDGLRHVVGLYAGIYFFLAGFILHKILAHVRRNGQRAEHGLAVALAFWFLSFAHIAFLPLKDIALLQKDVVIYTLNLIVVSLTLLTAMIAVLYYLRSSLFKLPGGFLAGKK